MHAYVESIVNAFSRSRRVFIYLYRATAACIPTVVEEVAANVCKAHLCLPFTSFSHSCIDQVYNEMP